MTNKLFGTDGVRGIANIYPMNADFAFSLAKVLSNLVCTEKKTVAIGKDTRISGDMLESALTAGFTSKWYLASGAVSSSLGFLSWLVPVVLLVSAILTAGYLLPITFNGFFVGKEKYEKNEASKLMCIPMIILALLIIVVGVFNQPLIDLIMSIMKG